MDSIDKIGRVEAIALLITIISNNIILNVPSSIIDNSGTGSWLNLIYITIISFIFIFIVCKFSKPFVGLDIVDISGFLGKKVLKIIIGFLYIILFMFFSALCLRYFSHALQNIYFNDTPLVFLILLFLIPSVIAAKTGLKAISGANLIFIPIAVFAIIILFITASKDFVWERLFPVLGYGVKETFFYKISNLFGFNVIAYLYFLKPFLNKESDFKKISIFTVVLCGFYLLCNIFSLLMTFPFITQTNEILSLYLLARLISFGRFLQRVDAIFIFIWVLTTLSFLSLNLFLITQIFKKLFNLKSSSELVYPISAFFFCSALLIEDISVLKLFARNFARIFNNILIFVISFIILILSYIKKKKRGVDT